nr:unnamed protein product [Spirometra erinaceieuropaei]
MKAPAMIASLYAAAALGPVFGYALGALMIQYPADHISSHRITPKDLTPDDPNWIGAWWAGYIFLGVGTFIGALILLLFPRHLRSSFELTDRPSSFVLLTDSTFSNNATASRTAALEDSSTAAKGNEMKIENQSNAVDVSPASPTTATVAEKEICFANTLLDRRLSMNMSFSPPRSRMSIRDHRRTQSSGGSMLLRAAIAAATASHAEEASFSTDSGDDEDDDDEFQDVPEALPRHETRPHQLRLEHALRNAGPVLVATPLSATPGDYALGIGPEPATTTPNSPPTSSLNAVHSVCENDPGRTSLRQCHRMSKQDIPRCICKLLRNKVYIVTCFCICCEMFIIIGFAGFLPKYLETEYQTSKSQASMIAGGLIVPAGALGILVGGLILNRARLRRRGAIVFVLCVNFVILGCLITFFFAGCENAKVAGFTSEYPLGPFKDAVADGLTPPNCFSTCDCDHNAWMPVCHLKTGITFPSPCFAGCSSGPFTSAATLQRERFFRDCSCLASFVTDFPAHLHASPAASNNALLEDEVQAGACHMSCNTLIPFVCVLTVALFLTGVIQNPLLMVTMRSVGKSERSLALGLQFVIIRLLANLPSPITFGRVIDGACLSWRDECGRRGDCALTDRRYLTFYLTANQTVNELRVVSTPASNQATSIGTESHREGS